jgi:hypothetical protein
MAHKRKPDDEAVDEVAGNSHGASCESSRVSPRHSFITESYPNNPGSVHATYSAPQHPREQGPVHATPSARAPHMHRACLAERELPRPQYTQTMPFLHSVWPVGTPAAGALSTDAQRAAAPPGARCLSPRRPARAPRICAEHPPVSGQIGFGTVCCRVDTHRSS